MRRTVYEQAAVGTVNELMEDPQWAQVICQYNKLLHSGEWPASYVDVFMEKWARFQSDIYDAHSFSLSHTMLRTGELAVFQVPIQETPCADSQVDGMNQRLGLLAYPFKGEFWGGCSDTDGSLSWERPINVLVQRDGGVGFAIVPPGGCALEVGYCASHKILVFLRTGMGLARWPYDRKRITVLIPTWRCRFAGDDGFDELRDQVYGDFKTLPNPYDDWWRKGAPDDTE